LPNHSEINAILKELVKYQVDNHIEMYVKH